MTDRVVIDRRRVDTPDGKYLPLRSLAQYCGLSVRKLRAYLRDPVSPLPHYRVGGKILVLSSDFDSWVARFRASAAPTVDRVVDDVMRGLL